MAEAILFLKDGKKDKIDIKDSVFSLEINPVVISEVVRAYLLNQRKGTASTKRRAEVRGGGKKPWRQKGTGRARTGSLRNPIFRGGGIIFGPKPRNFSLKIPKKKKQLALKYAFSDFYKNKKMIVVESLELEKSKTKEAVDFLKKLNIEAGKDKVIVLDKDVKKEIRLSFRNIPKLEILSLNNVNTYILLWADILILTKDALKRIEELWG